MAEGYSETFTLYDLLPVPISVVDSAGRLLYYNSAAAAAFDRKPEYVGRDIRGCHKRQGSIDKIEALLGWVRDNDQLPAAYEVDRNGKRYRIVISRLNGDKGLCGLVQCAIPLDRDGQT